MTSRLATLGFVLLASLASTAMADEGGGHHRHHPLRNFTEDTVRTYADGSTFHRHVQQSVVPGAITRQVSETGPQGRTASRTVTTHFDRSTQVWSRTVQGTRFDGSSYSMSAQGQGFPGHHRHRFEGGAS